MNNTKNLCFFISINYRKTAFDYGKSILDKQLLRRYNSLYGLVAQLGERTVRIRKVEGSIPFESTRPETSFVYQGKRGFYLLDPILPFVV